LVRAQLNIPEGTFCIGSFQKDSPGWDNSSQDMKWVKGPDVFADVVERLASRYPIYVLLTSPARGYLISRLKQAGIPYRHDVLDKPEELVRYYHALDLYLITSRDEGGPMSMLEAMATCVPVVSTRMGIPKDAIKHRQNGMLAEIDDVEGLATAVEQMIRDNELRDRVAANARNTILAYDWSLIADKYARLLYNLPPKT
jgi:glycosyltransferase involved in cell wall biosynthesis